MTSLFEPNGIYTDTAKDLDREFINLVKPFLEKHAEHPVRELEYIALQAVNAVFMRERVFRMNGFPRS
jgi:hypothetical protein